MGLLDEKLTQLKAYIEANTPRNTRPAVSPSRVMNEGLINPNQYNAPAANNFKDSALGLLGGVPGVGDYASGVQAADYWKRGEKGNALLAGLGTLPIIPSLVAGGATLGGLGVMNRVAQRIGSPLPAGPARNQAGAIVYHGSPHKFDKFDMDKIGTGEGAQAYGHGLYMAESQGVAKQYADNVKDMGAIKDINIELGRLAKIMSADEIGYRNYRSDVGRKAAGEYDALMAKRSGVSQAEGNLYKVDIPDESIPRMLDWDKLLSEQHPDVQKAALDMYGPELKRLQSTHMPNAKPLDMLTGDELYRRLTSSDGAPNVSLGGDRQWASDQLKARGIPGIRYLDGNSRGAGGTSNYVLFDDQLPRIIETNGQPTGLLSYADEAKKAKK